ncbi:hypothetical protein [Rhodanobacter sp. FW106-PBR-LB-2-11]|uniref:hypothetical protein n=1 Tax=Rhodanobacter sp. FW106-PBR-LB-2-11 TaxID=1524463 RepID=UPI0034E3F209
MTDGALTDEAALAKQQFRQCENELLAALNGFGRPVAGDAELVSLRRAVLQARHACERAGVAVETLWEFTERNRLAHEEQVRTFAREQVKVAPRLPFVLRQRITAALAAATGLVVLVTWPSPDGLLGALAASVVALAVGDDCLARLFPTPTSRVARLACDLGVDVADLWPPGSVDRKDYVLAYRRHLWHLRRRGENTGWIRAR